MKKNSFSNKFLYFLNALLATILLLSYLLPFVSPITFSLFSLLSLLVPVLFLINLGFAIFWIIKLKKHFILSTLVLTVGYFASTAFYKFTHKNSALNNDLKVMSYNVRTFNYWKWSKEENIDKKIIAFVEESDIDILAVQEYMSLPEYKFNLPYSYIKKKYARGRFGTAIFSKHPIINKGFLELGKTGNEIIFADILRNKDTIRVYNLHLQSFGIKPEKENFGEENSEKLIKKLRNNFVKQAEQVAVLVAHEQQWKGKKIICGDFNNTAYSWVYNQIAKDKKDAFLEAGKGFGKSFNYWFPLRIDFIITDKTATINHFKTGEETYSDHFPISSRINWKK